MKKTALILLWTFLSSISAFANGVWVSGKSRPVNLGDSMAQISQFRVTYLNSSLAWGSSVKLLYGVRSTWKAWANPNSALMSAAAGSTWQVVVDTITGNRELGNCSSFEFVFEITDANGFSHYDNGGVAPMGFYSTPVPYYSVSGPNLADLPVQVKASE